MYRFILSALSVPALLVMGVLAVIVPVVAIQPDPTLADIPWAFVRLMAVIGLVMGLACAYVDTCERGTRPLYDAIVWVLQHMPYRLSCWIADHMPAERVEEDRRRAMHVTLWMETAEEFGETNTRAYKRAQVFVSLPWI